MALRETDRRRQKQIEYNESHGIEPRTISKSVDQVMTTTSVADSRATGDPEEQEPETEEDRIALLMRLQKEMEQAAGTLQFEKAAELRDRIIQVRQDLDEGLVRRARRGKLRKR